MVKRKENNCKLSSAHDVKGATPKPCQQAWRGGEPLTLHATRTWSEERDSYDGSVTMLKGKGDNSRHNNAHKVKRAYSKLCQLAWYKGGKLPLHVKRTWLNVCEFFCLELFPINFIGFFYFGTPFLRHTSRCDAGVLPFLAPKSGSHPHHVTRSEVIGAENRCNDYLSIKPNYHRKATGTWPQIDTNWFMAMKVISQLQQCRFTITKALALNS